MDINKILLVMDRTGEKEKNTIVLVTEKNKNILKKYNVILQDLDTSYGAFHEIIPDLYMKRCCDYKELSEFYAGKYNLSENFITHFDSKNAELCKLLRQIALPHYIKTDILPKKCQKINNVNGKIYTMIGVLNKNSDSIDAMLLDTDSLNIIIAYGLRNYNISYSNDKDNKLSMNAYEWDHGKYYNPLDLNTNLRAVYLSCADKNPEIRDVYEYRNELIFEYLATQNIIKDKRYDNSIRAAAKKVLANKFMNLDFDSFDKALMQGTFDDGYKKDKITKCY